MESECRAAWADLPAELLAIISDSLEETCSFRGVCRSWRSSATIIPNKISRLFPHTLSPFPTLPGFISTCKRCCLVANAVYHIRSEAANWIVSVQESKPGKLFLSHALTREPISGSSGFVLDDDPGLTRTQLSIYHSFHSTCECRFCRNIAPAKLVVFPNPADDGDSMALFQTDGQLFAVRRCLTDHPAAAAGQMVVVQNNNSTTTTKPFFVHDFVSFNGFIYAVDYQGHVFVLDPGTLLRLLPLPCVNKASSSWDYYIGKRFVVSDGDLYLVFNFHRVVRRGLYKVYKLVIMKDHITNAPTCYNLELVRDLGDRLFFVLNKYCSFSVSARDLPPPFVGKANCILLGESPFPASSNIHQSSCIYHLRVGGKPKPTTIPPKDLNYSPLFHPNQLHKGASQIKSASQIKRRRNKEKRKSRDSRGHT